MLAAKHIDNLDAVDLPKAKCTLSHLEEFTSMDDLNRQWKIINPNATDLRNPRTEDGRYKCSVGGISKEYTYEMIRERVGGTTMAYWGQGYTSAKEGDIIHRTYVGYKNDTPIFFLRWAEKGK